MSLSRIDPRPEDAFEYPYFLSVPQNYAGEVPILVEPSNSAQPSDDFEVHREEAKRRADRGFGRRIADELDAPYLHPAFPRPVSDPVDWTHSIHQLCARTIRIDGGPLERVDRQLLAMIDDARERVADGDGNVPPRVMMNGFSASAAFANRFCILHPDRVLSVSIGGVNGILTLPRSDLETDRDLTVAQSLSLDFPVGVADVERYTGTQFDAASFRDVSQFIYMGAEDDKDVLLWPDVWTETDLRAAAILTYGRDIHEDRFPYCASVYEKADADAIFRSYPETGHDPSPAEDDILTFHEQCLDGTDTDDIEEFIGGEPVE